MVHEKKTALAHPIHNIWRLYSSILFIFIFFPSLGLGDNLGLLPPNSASHHSLTLSFYISQTELEVLHSLFLSSF